MVEERRRIICVALVLSFLVPAWLLLTFSEGSDTESVKQKRKEGWSIPRIWFVPQEIADDHQLDTAQRDLSLWNVVFGIGSSASTWMWRKELVRAWWRPDEMRGCVWLDEDAPSDSRLPPVIVSEDTTRFWYTSAHGSPTGIRMARIILEMWRLRLPDVQWFVMSDDDTVFCVENLVRVLSKYNSSEFWYIGSKSESHIQNLHFSRNMAFGGGGFAISSSLAESLASTMDSCLTRYPHLVGSDDRVYACVSEHGVPITTEVGFHQCDIMGDARGLFGSHPIAPFISMHHIEALDPLFPNLSRQEGLIHFLRAMRVDPTGFLQQSICYDEEKRLSFSLSNGYVVQVHPKIIPQQQLTQVELTFSPWMKKKKSSMKRTEFNLDVRFPPSSCSQAFLFFLNHSTAVGHVDDHVSSDVSRGGTVSTYARDANADEKKKFCWRNTLDFKGIRVRSKPLGMSWYMNPRRQCCRVGRIVDEVLEMEVVSCN